MQNVFVLTMRYFLPCDIDKYVICLNQYNYSIPTSLLKMQNIDRSCAILQPMKNQWYLFINYPCESDFVEFIIPFKT